MNNTEATLTGFSTTGAYTHPGFYTDYNSKLLTALFIAADLRYSLTNQIEELLKTGDESNIKIAAGILKDAILKSNQ